MRCSVIEATQFTSVYVKSVTNHIILVSHCRELIEIPDFTAAAGSVGGMAGAAAGINEDGWSETPATR